jgi:hypothetical protein
MLYGQGLNLESPICKLRVESADESTEKFETPIKMIEQFESGQILPDRKFSFDNKLINP